MVISQSESSEKDFVVYYNKDEELLKNAYNGQSHQWSDLEKMFSKIDILDYLHFPTSSDHNLLRFQTHSFFYLGEGAFNVVWSFKSRNNSLFSHESTVGTFSKDGVDGAGSDNNNIYRIRKWRDDYLRS